MLRSSSDLKVGEMSNAINNFRHWAEDNGYYLPEASENEDGTMQFNSEKDRQAFEKAEIETERASQFIN